MNVSIKIQHLATIKDVEVSLLEKTNSLKEKIERLFSIPTSQQALMLDGRNISTAAKPLGELGLREGALVVVRKMHRFKGQSRGTDLASIMQNPMLKGMIKNPEMMKSIQEMFPDLKEEMSNNKTLNMMINSGGLEEELEKMTTDSEYMNLQLRNADVTMAKLGNIPGGINMMSGMMREAEDPFKLLNQEAALKGSHRISEKITSSLPGASKSNLSVEYRKQLSELKEIGFENVRDNIEALSRTGGDLQAALEILVKKYENI